MAVHSLIEIREQMDRLLAEYMTLYPVDEKDLIVLGVSTSEVIGQNIGTSGALEIAETIYTALSDYEKKTDVALAYQCCEHLNRALVIDKAIARQRGYEQVTVTPIQEAGGAMATYAYKHMINPVVVETIEADGGIDIGSTLIGMHLKRVAVPLRSDTRLIGSAPITIAKTRPKLIGGERASYAR